MSGAVLPTSGICDACADRAVRVRSCPQPACGKRLCHGCEELHQCEALPDDGPLMLASRELLRLSAWLELISLGRGIGADYASQALDSSSWPDKPTRSNPKGGGR